MRFHGSHIGILHRHTAYTLCIDFTNQIIVVAHIDIGRHIDAAARHETEVNSHIELTLLLVGKFRVCKVGKLQSEFLNAGDRTPRTVRIVNHSGVRHPVRTAVGCQRIRQAQRSMAEHFIQSRIVAEPVFFMGVPCAGNVPRRQPACRAGFSKFVRSLVADSSVDNVTAGV